MIRALLPYMIPSLLIGAGLLLVLGVCAWRQRHRDLTRPATPDWRVWDEELPRRLSPVEQEMRAAFRTADQARRWPVNRELAAEDAAWKRTQDGAGDQ